MKAGGQPTLSPRVEPAGAKASSRYSPLYQASAPVLQPPASNMVTSPLSVAAAAGPAGLHSTDEEILRNRVALMSTLGSALGSRWNDASSPRQDRRIPSSSSRILAVQNPVDDSDDSEDEEWDSGPGQVRGRAAPPPPPAKSLRPGQSDSRGQSAPRGQSTPRGQSGFRGRGRGGVPQVQAYHNSRAESSSPPLTLETIAREQQFNGGFFYEPGFLGVVYGGVQAIPTLPALLADLAGDAGVKQDIWATVLVLACLKRVFGGEKDSWEMMAEKATGFVEDALNGMRADGSAICASLIASVKI